jgi:hypothetical protein
MAEIVNLRAARKHKERETREQDAAANRAKFGRTKSEKEKRKLESARTDKVLDGHKLED